MKKTTPKVTISLPSDELVYLWNTKLPNRQNERQLYEKIEVPTNKDAEWVLSKLPNVNWNKYVYRIKNHDGYFQLPGIIACQPDQEQLNFAKEFKKLRKLEQLIYATHNKITYLTITKKLEEPLHLKTMLSENEILLEHVVITVEEDVDITIIDTIETQGKDHFLGRSVNIVVKKGGKLNFISNLNTVESSHYFNFYSFFACENSIIEGGGITLGCGYSKTWIDLFLVGRRAQIHIDMLMGITGNGYGEIIFYQQHHAPQSKSNVSAKGLVRDHSSLMLHGTVTIHDDADKCEADQQTAVLLLSEQARAITVPSLEVKTNDVQCTHGSAIGKINTEDLFYLQARGLTINLAHDLLITAFISECFQELEDKYIGVFLKRFIEECGLR